MIRKIMTAAEKEARDTRNKRIMGIVLGIVMLLSTAGYFVFDFSGTKTQTVNYAGIKFVQTQYGTWSFSYGGNNYETIYLPEQTKNISIIMTKTLSEYYNKPLYISAEPIEDIASAADQEILKNLNNLIGRANFACMNNNCSQNYPVKNCSEDNIILFEKSQDNNTKIRQNEKCVVLTYTLDEEERLADAFLFGVMGIK